IDEDEEMAESVLDDHAKIKEIHLDIVKALNNDKEITVKEAIVVAKVTGYLRRVSAHLGNICTGVIRPFPKMGFLKKTSRELDADNPLYSRTKLD
ncbi:MAG: PhoU domain-containing protein, partial [Thermoplasmata archaeon]|nr:PhoU domain-containing protein [Thermoplasmata archaeon]